MGESGSVMIAFVIDKYLSLVLKPSKGMGMNDPVPVPLKDVTERMLVLLITSSS